MDCQILHVWPSISGDFRCDQSNRPPQIVCVKSFLHRLKKHIHHGSIDPRQKQTDIFTGCRINSTIHVKIRIAGLYCGNLPDSFSSPEFSCYWLKPEPPFIKEKYYGLRTTTHSFMKFFKKPLGPAHPPCCAVAAEP